VLRNETLLNVKLLIVKKLKNKYNGENCVNYGNHGSGWFLLGRVSAGERV
jgi:hypothetical protein